MLLNQTTFFPRQRLSFKEKKKDDFQWAKDTMDTIIGGHSGMNPSYLSQNAPNNVYDNMRKNYDLFNNVLTQEDFERDCNLLGLNVGQFKDEIAPYNKIPNKIQSLLGDEYTRPSSLKTVLVNSGGINTKNVKRTMAVQELLNSRIAELVQSVQEVFAQKDTTKQQTKQELQKLVDRFVDPEEIEMYSQSNFLEEVEITGSKILNYLRHKLELTEKRNDIFKHGLISAHEVCYIGAVGENPDLTTINPLGFFYHKSPDVKYFEDGLYAGYQSYMDVGQVLDTFTLSQEQEDILQNRYLYSKRDNSLTHDMRYPDDKAIWNQYQTIFNGSEGQFGEIDRAIDIEVTHVEWRSQVRVYIVTYVDPETGEESRKLVSEDFEIPKEALKVKYRKYNVDKVKYVIGDFTIEEEWLPQVWEGVRIDGDIYVNIGPKEHQFRSVDDPTHVKLGYHGTIHANTNSQPVSLLDRIKPFQYLYFFVMHKTEQLIAKDRGKLSHVDLSMMSEKLGLEKTLYYLDQLDIDFYNSLQNAEEPGAAQRGKITQATDRSNIQAILGYMQILAYLDEQISDISGISKPREGQTPTRQAVTNAQQDLRQSALVTEATYFAPHYNMWRRAMTSLLSLTMDLWRGKHITKQWLLDDMSVEVLNIKPNDFDLAELGVFLSNVPKELETFYALRNYAQALIQNEMASVEDLVEILASDSIQQLKAYIKKSQKRKMQQQQALQEQQNRAAQEIENAKTEQEARKLEAEMQIEKLKADTEITVAQIRALASAPTELDKEKMRLEWEKLKETKETNDEKLKLEEKKIKQAAQKREVTN